MLSGALQNSSESVAFYSLYMSHCWTAEFVAASCR